MKSHKPLLILLSFSFVLHAQTYAQKPDFIADSLFVVSGKPKSKLDAQASVKLYCDGEYVSVIVHVKDDFVEYKSGRNDLDHVEIWFALPNSAYSKDFEYNFHPRYLYAQPPQDPYQKPQPIRFFSAYSEYTPQLGIQSFTKTFDYPSGKDISSRKLPIPKPENLRESRIDYGIVQYAFYPDERPVLHLNKTHYSLLEQNWQQKVGSFAEGVQYSVDKTEKGYTIHAQFSAAGLGFVQLPKMEEIRCMVDVIDTEKGEVPTVLSTSQYHDKLTAISFNNVRFKRPLRTNNTQIPDAIFTKLDFKPVYTLMEGGQWVSTDAQTDLIAYEPEKLSKALVEIKFVKQPIRYSAYTDNANNNIKKLSVDKTSVNTRPVTTEYYLINGKVFESEVVRMPKDRRENLLSHTFSFPDGAAGIILKNRTAQNAYGWGKCKDCFEEIISIMRISGNQSKTIFGIYQGNTGNTYCQIGEQRFDGYYVYGMDWLREGKIMVLRLSNWENTVKKRVKVTWRDDGTKVLVKEIVPK